MKSGGPEKELYRERERGPEGYAARGVGSLEREKEIGAPVSRNYNCYCYNYRRY